MYRMDRATYGLPNWNMTQTQKDQFKSLPSTLGRGIYKEYNQTAPVPVSLTWTLTDVQLRAFHDAWHQRDQLCWGAAWFLLDLPLGLDKEDASTDLTQTIDVANTFQVTVGTDGTSLGWGKAVYGSIQPAKPTVNGSELTELRYNISNELFFIQTADGQEIPGVTDLTLQFPDSAAGLTSKYTATWAAPTTRYQFATDANVRDHWTDTASAGVIITAPQPLWRSYRCTMTEGYQTTLKGTKHWDLTMNVIVDRSPATDWFIA